MVHVQGLRQEVATLIVIPKKQVKPITRPIIKERMEPEALELPQDIITLGHRSRPLPRQHKALGLKRSILNRGNLPLLQHKVHAEK